MWTIHWYGMIGRRYELWDVIKLCGDHSHPHGAQGWQGPNYLCGDFRFKVPFQNRQEAVDLCAFLKVVCSFGVPEHDEGVMLDVIEEVRIGGLPGPGPHPEGKMTTSGDKEPVWIEMGGGKGEQGPQGHSPNLKCAGEEACRIVDERYNEIEQAVEEANAELTDYNRIAIPAKAMVAQMVMLHGKEWIDAYLVSVRASPAVEKAACAEAEKVPKTGGAGNQGPAQTPLFDGTEAKEEPPDSE